MCLQYDKTLIGLKLLVRDKIGNPLKTQMMIDVFMWPYGKWKSFVEIVHLLKKVVFFVCTVSANETITSSGCHVRFFVLELFLPIAGVYLTQVNLWAQCLRQ